MIKKKPVSKLTLKDIAYMGVMVAILEVAKISLSFIPNVELVSLFIILYTLYFEKKITYVILVFVIIEGLLYGFSMWWFSYLYIWYLLAFLTYLFRRQKSAFFYAMIGSLHGFCFGALLTPVTFLFQLFQTNLTQSLSFTFAWWVAGIPWDIIHGISNFIVIFLLYSPLRKIFSYLSCKDFSPKAY